MGFNNRNVGISDPQIDELPFQKGALLDPPEVEEKQDIKDLYRKVLMVHISKFHESDDDSMQRLNLDDYNSDDYDEYLFDNMETSPMPITEVKTSAKQDAPLAPPSVTVTIQLKDEPAVEDFYERRRICNQKLALRCQHVADHLQEQQGNNYDYSNSDLRNVINIGATPKM